MGAVWTAPPRHTTYDEQLRSVDREVARLHRKRIPVQQTPPFVKVQPVAVQTWKPGTCWLNTSVIGPLNSHPLLVKLDDGSWDHVAWLVPDG